MQAPSSDPSLLSISKEKVEEMSICVVGTILRKI
jgi:hypothetical protein